MSTRATSSPTVPVDRPQGELALGRNVARRAFMPWNGYNYEDSILISERIVPTTCSPRSTSRNPKSMARHEAGSEDHPRHPERREEALRNLDEAGIVYIGAEVSRATSWSARSRRRAKAR